jgi:hypothetical protein
MTKSQKSAKNRQFFAFCPSITFSIFDHIKDRYNFISVFDEIWKETELLFFEEAYLRSYSRTNKWKKQKSLFFGALCSSYDRLIIVFSTEDIKPI